MSSLEPYGIRRLGEDGPCGSMLPSHDAIFSSSWPAVTPSRLRPEPPKAPCRKPSFASWDVPPLSLPAAKRRAPGINELDEEDDKDDETTEDTCVFSLDLDTQGRSRAISKSDSKSGGSLGDVFGNGDANDYDDEDDDDDVFGGTPFKYDLAQLGADMDDLDLGGYAPDRNNLEFAGEDRVGFRGRLTNSDLALGTSPSLLSALNQVAAEANSQRRPRHGSV